MRKSTSGDHLMRSHQQRSCMLEALETRQLLSAALPNIMPMGDSITEAFSGHASYRYWLWNSLADAGYTANFAGIGAGVSDGPPLLPGYDTDHEGFSGWRADDMLAHVQDAGWKNFALMPQNKPDIVLLHIGSNDVEQGQSNSTTRDEIGKIIDALRAINPNVKILLARLVPETGISMSGLNSLLPALVSAKTTSRSPVILVDQSGGFSSAADTYDGVHPNEAGEKKMAAKWLAALKPLLPAPVAQPEGTYLDTPAVPMTKVINPIGPVEYELSNGSDGQYDGQMLSLRGKQFMRGFGVHANSELDFDLTGGNYSRFRATVGVDDEVNGLGSVIFKIYVNKEAAPRFVSPILTGESAALPIDVDISGATLLRLVVSDAGNDNDFDHADWALPRLIKATTTTPEPPAPAPAVETPAAPTNLRGKVRGRRVDLCWTDTANNETGFRVERRLGTTGAWRQIAELGANTRAYRDTKVAAGFRYSYRVVAYNAHGVSNPSNVTEERIPGHVKKAKPEHRAEGKDKIAKSLTKAAERILNLIDKLRK